MRETIKRQKFWIITNLAAIVVFLLVASATWDIDHGLGGLFIEYVFLNLLQALCIVFNAIWLLLILIGVRQPKILLKLSILAFIAFLWTGVFVIEARMFDYWREQAQKA